MHFNGLEHTHTKNDFFKLIEGLYSFLASAEKNNISDWFILFQSICIVINYYHFGVQVKYWELL